MKEKALLIFLILLIAGSVFLTYQRSFVTQDFELINSEEGAEEESGLEESEGETDPVTEEVEASDDPVTGEDLQESGSSE